MSALPTSSTLMPHRWYIKTSSGKTGPFTVQELQLFADKQKISPVTAITSDGNKWVKAKRVRGLHFASENPSQENAEPPLVPAPTIAAPSEVSFQPFGMKADPPSPIQPNKNDQAAAKADALALAKREEELGRVDQELSKVAITLDQREAELTRRESELEARSAEAQKRSDDRSTVDEQASIQAEELSRKESLLDQQKVELEEQEKQVSALQSEIATQQDELEKRQQELEQRNTELEERSKLQQELESQQAELQAERDSLQGQVSALESREQALAEREKELETLIAENEKQEGREQQELDLQQRFAELTEKEQGLSLQLTEFGSRESELQKLAAELTDREGQAAAFEANLAERATEAANREKVIAERETSLTERESDATKREAAISERESEQNARDQKLVALDEEIKLATEKFDVRETELVAKEEALVDAQSKIDQRDQDLKGREEGLAAKIAEIAEQQERIDAQLAEFDKRQAAVNETEEDLAKRVSETAKIELEFSQRENDHAKRFADLQARAAEISKAELLLIERETLVSKREAEVRRRESQPAYTGEIAPQPAQGIAGLPAAAMQVAAVSDSAPTPKRKPAALPPRIEDSVDEIDSSLTQSSTVPISAAKTVVMEPFEPMEPAQTITPDEPQDHTARRQQEYDRLFGPPVRVESSPTSSIQVSVHPPTPSRGFITLVTNGMSDFQMPTKSSETARAELIMYVREEDPLYMEIMHSLAQVPAAREMPFEYGTTINNGNPPQPIVERSVLDGFVFMVPVVDEDFRMKDRVRIEGERLNLLWVTPTTSSEREVIRRSSLEDFFQLLEKYDHPVVFNPFRKCYSKRKWFSR